MLYKHSAKAITMIPLAVLDQCLDFFLESEYTSETDQHVERVLIMTGGSIKRASLNYSYWDPLFLSL